MNVEIIFEDDHIIAVNKPNNVLVHHSYYSRNITDDSLLQLLRKQNSGKLYPIHRLDRKTSGIIILAKQKEEVNQYQTLFIENQIKKTYHALVRGHILEQNSIDSPVKNDLGKYKSALTHYQPLKNYTLDIPVKPYPQSRYTLVEYTPKTGRMHQLRIHSNKIAHPIIGDHKYGNRHHNRMFEEQLKLPNLFLHAIKLEFICPFDKQLIVIRAEKPNFWNQFLALSE